MSARTRLPFGSRIQVGRLRNVGDVSVGAGRTTWSVANGSLPPLGDVVFVPDDLHARPQASPGQRRRWVRWWQLFHADLRGAVWAQDLFAESVDESEPLPACIAKVIVLQGEVHVLLSPIGIGRTMRRAHVGSGLPMDELSGAEVDELEQILRRWPTLAAVRVEDVGTVALATVATLRQRGFAAVVSPLEMVPTDIGFDETEDGHGWTLYADHRSPYSPNLRRIALPFGHDVEKLAEFAGSLLVDRPIRIAAATQQSDAIALLESAGVPTRARLPHRFRFTGHRQSIDGLDVQLSVTGTGWMDVILAVTGQEFRFITSAVLSDGWSDLITGVRIAAVDGQAAHLFLWAEPDGYDIVLLPSKENGRVSFEVWWLEDELDRSIPRRGELRARWTGPARALAEAVVAASRSLIDVAGWDAISDKWGFPPPTPELYLIDEWLAVRARQDSNLQPLDP